jgi:hypothetical protein
MAVLSPLFPLDKRGNLGDIAIGNRIFFTKDSYVNERTKTVNYL